MRTKSVFLLICLMSLLPMWGKGINSNTITEEGAWCWFADPRALTYKS